MLVEYASDGGVQGIGGDGQQGVADRVDEEYGVGDGLLDLVDGVDHLRADGDLLPGTGERVSQGADDVSKARYIASIKIDHT